MEGPRRSLVGGAWAFRADARTAAHRFIGPRRCRPWQRARWRVHEAVLLDALELASGCNPLMTRRVSPYIWRPAAAPGRSPRSKERRARGSNRDERALLPSPPRGAPACRGCSAAQRVAAIGRASTTVVGRAGTTLLQRNVPTRASKPRSAPHAWQPRGPHPSTTLALSQDAIAATASDIDRTWRASTSAERAIDGARNCREGEGERERARDGGVRRDRAPAPSASAIARAFLTIFCGEEAGRRSSRRWSLARPTLEPPGSGAPWREV